MGSRTWARSEREALCDLLAQLGPEQPTLCTGWTTRDLAAHLVNREGRLDASLDRVIPQLRSRAQRIHDRTASRPWPELLATLRSGPPRWSPFRLPRVDAWTNTGEMFIHHEDVRRAQPDWRARDLDPRFADALWRLMTSRFGSVWFRRSPVGVRLVRRDGSGGRRRVRSGDRAVTITGAAAEILLFATGRKEHALVTVDGDPEVVALVAALDLSI